MTDARQMEPEDLTREGYLTLLDAGFEQYVIRRHYNFNGEAFYLRLREWGLNKKTTKDLPRVPKAPVQEDATPVHDLEYLPVETVERLTAVEWLRQHGTIPAPSEVKAMTSGDWKKDEAAELLRAGATYIQMAAYYGWKGIGSVSYYVKRDGLIGVSPNLRGKSAKAVIDKLNGHRKRGEPISEEASSVRVQIADGQIYDFGACRVEHQELFPISEAVTQTIEAGEVKIANVEHPTPPATIDISAMRRFVPGRCGHNRINKTITVSASGTVRLAAGLISTGPECHHARETKFHAAVYVRGEVMVVHPELDGYVFSSHKETANKKAGAKMISDYLAEQGIALPAVFEAEWNEQQEAYVGQLVEKVSA
jgi:hypothetical protein